VRMQFDSMVSETKKTVQGAVVAPAKPK
jgi:hypothetical protein